MKKLTMEGFISSISQALIFVLWFAIPVFLVTLSWKLRLIHKRQQFIASIEWEMLEVKIPKDIVKTPKSMEQVFASIYGIYSFGFIWMTKYLDGKIEQWVSFEIAAKSGGIRFYIKTPKSFRSLIESSIYSQYPDAEIVDVEDYTQELPSVVPNELFDIFGSSYVLSREYPYPIKTYLSFDDREFDDQKRLDPLAGLFESMSKLKEDERVWIQILVSAAGKQTGLDIKKEGDEIIKKLIEEKTKPESDDPKSQRGQLTHGVQEVIKGIENKCSKNVFQVTFRFIYIAPKDQFNSQNIPSIMGSFQQFNTQNMNGIRPDIKTMTIFSGWIARFFPKYKNSRILTKKRMLYDSYVQRRFGMTNRLSDSEKHPVLSTEELATLYHYPILTVRAPQIRRVDSRRSEPPVNLPVE